MQSGYVYILINESLKDLIKIGSTTFNSKQRAKELSRNTAIPTPFILVYDIYVADCQKVERLIHEELEEYRVNTNREFFRYPVYDAIKIIEKYKTKNVLYESIEIINQLKEIDQEYLKPEINSVSICQDEERVYLQYIQEEYIGEHLKDQTTRKVDLGFICDKDESLYFKKEDDITINTKKFIELDTYSKLMCTDLFTKEGEKNFI